MEIVIDNKLLENFYCYPCQFCEIFHMVFRFPVVCCLVIKFKYLRGVRERGEVEFLSRTSLMWGQSLELLPGNAQMAQIDCSLVPSQAFGWV